MTNKGIALVFAMEKNKNKKEALLKAAKELFGEYGYAETTFKKIAEKAGVALGLLAHHYGSKEKLFLASGLDVLNNFQDCLMAAIQDSCTGYEGVMNFCRAYLEFSINPESSWLVLVRCSPYSDMKTKKDRDLMHSRFAIIHSLLEEQLARGKRDGSLSPKIGKADAQVIISLLVGVNRTRVLTSYEADSLYEDALEFVSRAIRA